MENLLDSNFKLLANELFDVPRNGGIPYFQTGTNRNQFFQQGQHGGHSRSDFSLGDIRSGLDVVCTEDSLNEFKNLSYVDVSKNGSTSSNIRRNNRIGMEPGSSMDEFSKSNYDVNGSAGNRDIGCIDNSFFDVYTHDNSMNSISLETNSDTCIYQQNNPDNNLVYSRVLKNSPTQNINLNVNSNSSARVSKNNYLEEHVDLEKSDRLVSTDYRIFWTEEQNGKGILTDNSFHVVNASKFVSEFDDEQKKCIQGIVGRYNSICIDDQFLKMGIYSNCTNSDSNSSGIGSIAINKTNSDNSNENNCDEMPLPSFNHSSINASNSVLNGAFSRDLRNLDRRNSEFFRGRIPSSYTQRRLNSSDFGSCNMTNTTVSSEPSLSGIATPGGSSLNSGNSTDTLTQRFRNSSRSNLSYDILDVSSSNGTNFDKLSNNNIGINGYIRQINVSSADDSNIILGDVISEMNSSEKLIFAKNNCTYNSTGVGIDSFNHRIFGNCVMNNISNGVANNHAHDGHRSHNGVPNINSSNNSNITSNSNDIYNIKKSSKGGLIQSGFPTNGSNNLVIDDNDIYPIGHFVSNNANNPQTMNLLNGGSNQTDEVSINSNTNCTTRKNNINGNTNKSDSNINGCSHNNNNSNNDNNCNNSNNINNNNNSDCNSNNKNNGNVVTNDNSGGNNSQNNGITCINSNSRNIRNKNGLNVSNQSKKNNHRKCINAGIKNDDVDNGLTINTISNGDNCSNILNFITRAGIDDSSLVQGYISPYNECNSIDNKTNLCMDSGDGGGHFDISGSGSDQIHNIFGRLDTSGNYGMDSRGLIIDEMEFGSSGKFLWNQPSFCQYTSGSVGNGYSGILDWRSRQVPMFDRCKFVEKFGYGTLFNVSNESQQKQKSFGQRRNYNFQSNVNKQQKQVKQRSEASTNSRNFEVSQGITGSFRNCNTPLIFGECSDILRYDSNTSHYTNKSNKRNNGNIIGNMNGNMDGLPLNTSINIQNIAENGFINQGQMKYCGKTYIPNCSTQSHIGNNLFKRKSNINTSFGTINTCNSNSRLLGDFSQPNTNLFKSNMNTFTYNKKGMDEAHFTSGVKNGKKNHCHFNKVNITNISNNNLTCGNLFSNNCNCANSRDITVSNTPGATLPNSKNNVSGNEVSNSEASQNTLTPSRIAALWAKAMSKTGGRTGFNSRNKYHGSNYTQNGSDGRENNNLEDTQVASNSEYRNVANEIITCARFSSFLRNNSGRLHWLRVLYHYLDTVDINRIRSTNKEGDTPCMVAVDDIALETVSKSFDPSECAYWSEPENGAFVHKNIRLAVAHKVGHRTVVSPQNYVNQILTASLDHSVSILLNTLRAVDDRVRWMSTVVNCRSGGGFQIDIKLNRMGSIEGNQRNIESKDNVDSGCTTSSVSGNATLTRSSTNIEEFNDTVNTTSSTRNFPGRVFTVGVREAMRCLRHRKLKALIVAPDIEGDGVEGSLRHHVIHILLQAQELNIPTIFALNRHRIGRAMGKHMRMSVLGLLSIRGVEKQFQAISHTAQLLRKLYHFCVENNLPPTEETFKKLSSSINNIN